MTYVLVGLPEDETTDAMSITDKVLEGRAFRNSLISSGDMESTTISAHAGFLTEILDRMGRVFEGRVTPIALARRILSTVASGKSGRLFIWDMDKAQDYVLFVDNGYISFISSSGFRGSLERELAANSQSPIELSGPVYPGRRLITQLQRDLQLPEDPTVSFVISTSIESSAKMLGVKNVKLSWVEGLPQHESYLNLPIAEFIQLALETTASPQDLHNAVSQISRTLYPRNATDWKPWFPVAVHGLFEVPSDHYRMDELVRLFKSHRADKATEASVNAGLLTFLSSGYLQQGKPAEPNAIEGSKPQVATKVPEKDVYPKNYYKRLNVAADATILDIRRAFQARIADLDSNHETDEQRTAARHAYEEAEIILTDRMTRQAYDEALAAKVDFVEHGLAARILAEHFRKEGERRLRNRSYEEARNAFERALKYESNDEVTLQLHWATFLEGEQTQERANVVIENMKALEDGQLGHDKLYLYYGKVLRLCGNLETARKHLNKAVEFNKDNQEAWGELRLLNSTHSKRSSTSMKISLSADALDVKAVVIYSFICLGLMYGLAHFVPSGRTEWPMVDNQQLVNQTQSDDEYQTFLAQQLRDRIEKERAESKTIPQSKRVWGNVEYYHLADDSWFMTRRALLLVMGIVGILIFVRGRKEYLFPESANYGYAVIALPYGLIVGFLSYAPETITPLTGLLVMGLCTALAEHVFFFGFLGRSLLIQMESRLSS
ncbi:MAG: hypothetical protein ACPGQS_05615, partial [Bradymonadia bacterium]